MRATSLHDRLSPLMADNIILTKNKNESDASLLRRFSRRMKATGIMREVRARRYFSRDDSDYKRKTSALARLESAKRYSKLFKLGKTDPS